MALTANGLGSGLDINGLVGQLMSLERRPLAGLATKEASYQTKLSAFGQLKNVLSALQTAANALKDAAKFSATKATVSADAGFTATSTASAAKGSYSVVVNTLATAQRVATDKNTTFPPTSGQLSVTIGASTKTLDFAGGTIEQLRDAINGGDLGISASVIDNGTAKQLVLTGKNTGTANAFSVSGLGIETGLYQIQPAQNATLTVDGISITRASNTIDDVIEGVTLTLTKETATAGTVTVAEDTTGARSAIEGFVKAYNDTNKAIKDLTAFNAETRKASTLTGDSTARSIQTDLRNLVGDSISGLSGVSRLSDIGVSFKADGTLTIDSTKLDAALKDPAKNIGSYFAGVSGTTGFAEAISSKLENYIRSDGMLAGRTDGINASIKALEKQREALNTRLEKFETRYRAQFTALDSMIANLTQTSNFLTQQLANLPKIGE
ncbi:flagellar filament capping protein FliD [Aromatoleum evansii]|uniref:Flagellar hook-associated protein 2 n=1 Tax=Aromatoleum evansii TaxID=59406 RepID=A0ABZ1AI77_AROEV|nr:flagellar filament capping protein FliD [Aromatoleum evansii]